MFRIFLREMFRIKFRIKLYYVRLVLRPFLDILQKQKSTHDITFL